MQIAEWGGSPLSARVNLVKTTEQQNNKTTKQQNNKQQNNRTTKQQNNKTTKQQTTKQQNNKQQNNRTTKQYLRGKIVMYLFRPDETNEINLS